MTHAQHSADVSRFEENPSFGFCSHSSDLPLVPESLQAERSGNGLDDKEESELRIEINVLSEELVRVDLAIAGMMAVIESMCEQIELLKTHPKQESQQQFPIPQEPCESSSPTPDQESEIKRLNGRIDELELRHSSLASEHDKLAQECHKLQIENQELKSVTQIQQPSITDTPRPPNLGPEARATTTTTGEPSKLADRRSLKRPRVQISIPPLGPSSQAEQSNLSAGATSAIASAVSRAGIETPSLGSVKERKRALLAHLEQNDEASAQMIRKRRERHSAVIRNMPFEALKNMFQPESVTSPRQMVTSPPLSPSSSPMST